ncbi:hypothetical protein IGK86_000736 [Enterococcus sp. DIV1206]
MNSVIFEDIARIQAEKKQKRKEMLKLMNEIQIGIDIPKAWSIVKLKCLVRILVSKQWINLNQSIQLIKTSSPFKNICICSGLVIQ